MGPSRATAGAGAAGAHLLEQQPQRALRAAVELAQAVGSGAREQGDGGSSGGAGARHRPHRQRLAAPRRPVQQDAPARNGTPGVTCTARAARQHMHVLRTAGGERVPVRWIRVASKDLGDPGARLCPVALLLQDHGMRGMRPCRSDVTVLSVPSHQ